MMNLHFQKFCILTMRYNNKNNFLDDIGINAPEGNIANITIVKILHYILKHYKDITLADLAEHFNYSETHVSRIIKASTGKTFAEIRMATKIQKAAEIILKSANISIEDISHDVGYSEISTFYRAFRKIYGITPAAFRKKHLESQAQENNGPLYKILG